MPMENFNTDPTSLLRIWATIGASLRTSRTLPVAKWAAATRMIAAVRPKMEADAKRLQVLLEQSREKLLPLGEPFDLDLGLHRWLDAEREEAYSDWLEWVVRQAKTATNIFGLFGIDLPDDLPKDAILHVRREVRVAHGHADHEGRLDLVVALGDQVVLVIEVKKGDADHADTT